MLRFVQVRLEYTPQIGMCRIGDYNPVSPGDLAGHQHSFSSCRGELVQRGIGYVHGGELADHGLELVECLQHALRRFSLVGRVSGQELALQGQRIDDRGHEVIINAAAEEADLLVGRDVVVRQPIEVGEHFHLRQPGWNAQPAFDAVGGSDAGEQIID